MSKWYRTLAVSFALCASLQALARADYVMVKKNPAKSAAGLAPAADPPPRRIIFLNHNGGSYTSASENDSSMNLSSALDSFMGPGITVAVPSWGTSDDTWKATLACSRQMFGRFNVEVTDVDPGDVPHVEAVITSARPTDLGFSSGTGGISPFDCSTPVIERSIVWVFPRLAGDSPQRTCEIIAQEVAHSYQLDHELLCEDPMTYLDGCGTKTFQDQDAVCHDMSLHQAPCACTQASTQNSVQLLLKTLGPGETEPPAVAITSPAGNASVQPGFAIDAAVTDNYAIIKIDLWIDGAYRTSVGTSTEGLTAPRNTPIGNHTFELKAYDPGGNVGTASVAVKIDPECQTAADCGATKTCEGGICMGDVGAVCSSEEDCASSSCVLDEQNHKFCSRACGDGNGCPSGFTCTHLGASPVDRCYPGGDSGGCTVAEAGDNERIPLGAAVLLFTGLFVLRSHRRRAS